MIHLTIKHLKDYISIVDINNSGRCYNFFKQEDITPSRIYRIFRDVAIKTWMNRQTLVAFKSEIIKLYPNTYIDWNGIFDTANNNFDSRETKSTHVNLPDKAHNPYRRG